jgi:hypothetical protein
VAQEKRDRSWFGPSAFVAWLSSAVVVTVGGFLAWAVLGSGLCEDDDSPGSDAYCNHGGFEASGIAFAALVGLTLVVPAVALAAASRRWFWIGVPAPPALGVLVFVLSGIIGAD